FTDIFAIQDEVAKEVAARLRLRLSPAEQARLAKRHTANPAAYNYYTKAVYHFSNRDWVEEAREESNQVIELFKKAIELDPSYALAHAQLGYAYAYTTIVFEEDNPALIEQAKQEIDIAERLDPQLAEVHVARAFIFWSQYEGWQVEAAIRELRLAQQFDSHVGHFELADIYAHIGLDEQYEKEIELAMEIDPTSSILQRTRVFNYYMRAMPDDGLAAEQRYFNSGPGAWYYLEKRMLREAESLVAREYQQEPGDVYARKNRALLLALQGKHREAEAAVPAILEQALKVQPRGYHHFTYDAARIYALAGRRAEAIKWLKETAREGLPNYPLFRRDSFLERIRQDPAFINFMSEMKARWEGYRRAFG
ncbi:MAG TPA: hypothetical protein VNO70_27050, partial [Blastocatellia bacterium]|nr:hypothetical protein [Blastocatellia bacterium]